MDIQLKIKHRMGFCSDSSVDITFPIHFVWEKHFFCKFVAQNNLLQYDATRYEKYSRCH